MEKSRDVVRRVVNSMLAKGGEPITEIPTPEVLAERREKALAQLGARVLAIASKSSAFKDNEMRAWDDMCAIRAVARSLGLVRDEKGGRS